MKEVDTKTKMLDDFKLESVSPFSSLINTERPDAVLDIDPLAFVHFEIIGERFRLSGPEYLSPLYTKDQAWDIYNAMTNTKILNKGPFSLDYTKVSFRNSNILSREVALSKTHCKFGLLSIHGEEAFNKTQEALGRFYWGNYRTQRDPSFGKDPRGREYFVHKDNFGDGDKFVWWKFSERPEGYWHFDVSDPFSTFRCEFNDKVIYHELLIGVKKIMEGAKEYKLKVSPLSDHNFRLFRSDLPDGRYVVGISTDMLLYSQRAFLFFGEEHAKTFLQFVRKAKKLLS